MPIIACDDRGVIREATVSSRIGDVHPGAQAILRGETPFLGSAEMQLRRPAEEGGLVLRRRRGVAAAARRPRAYRGMWTRPPAFTTSA